MKKAFFPVLLSILSLQAYSQTLRWKIKTGGAIHSSAVTDGTALFIGSEDGNLYSLSPETGDINWKFQTNGGLSSAPYVSDQLVFVNSRDGNLYAIHSRTGKQVWKFKTEGEKEYDRWDYYLAGAVVSEEKVFFGSGDGHVYALEKNTGRLIWKFKTGDVVHATPALYADKLYVGSFDGFFYALSQNSGKLIWKFDTIGDTYFPKGEVQKEAVISNGIVYFGSRDYNIYALNTETGTGHWNRKETGSWIIAAPLIQDGSAYFGTSDTHAFYATDASTGTLKWKLSTGMRVYGSAVSDSTNVYFGCFDGKLYAVNQHTGEMAWSYQTDGSRKNYHTVYTNEGEFRPDFHLYGEDSEQSEAMIMNLGSVLSTPLLYKNILYFGSTDGYIYALHW